MRAAPRSNVHPVTGKTSFSLMACDEERFRHFIRYCQKFYEKQVWNIPKEKRNPPPSRGEGEGGGERADGCCKRSQETVYGY